jgi:hypothetical protein
VTHTSNRPGVPAEPPTGGKLCGGSTRTADIDAELGKRKKSAGRPRVAAVDRASAHSAHRPLSEAICCRCPLRCRSRRSPRPRRFLPIGGNGGAVVAGGDRGWSGAVTAGQIGDVGLMPQRWERLGG